MILIIKMKMKTNNENNNIINNDDISNINEIEKK